MMMMETIPGLMSGEGMMIASPSEIASQKKHRLKSRFQVLRKLGQGTYGKVQLAINKETGQEVAIKTIKKSKIESEQDLVRIRREIQIMSSIQHPHIIHIFEVFENKEKIVLVMQYASGGELYEYVSDRKEFNDVEARRLFRQIATAIYYCHKNKVCHRDLKLENILLDEKGNAKIGDFGLSNVFDEKHFLKTFCGSPLYASPEIVKGTPYYGPEVDCWSMGVLLYTLVYGAMPFDGSNFKKLVKQISDSNYYEPKNKSEASPLIRRLLTVNPSKRATIIDICSDSWVNQGFDNTLLQVAEDMANLTPVRLDILLALAPVSPTTDEEAASGIIVKSTPPAVLQRQGTSEQHPSKKVEVERKSRASESQSLRKSRTPSASNNKQDNNTSSEQMILTNEADTVEFIPSSEAVALEAANEDISETLVNPLSNNQVKVDQSQETPVIQSQVQQVIDTKAKEVSGKRESSATSLTDQRSKSTISSLNNSSTSQSNCPPVASPASKMVFGVKSNRKKPKTSDGAADTTSTDAVGLQSNELGVSCPADGNQSLVPTSPSSNTSSLTITVVPKDCSSKSDNTSSGYTSKTSSTINSSDLNTERSDESESVSTESSVKTPSDVTRKSFGLKTTVKQPSNKLKIVNDSSNNNNKENVKSVDSVILGETSSGGKTGNETSTSKNIATSSLTSRSDNRDQSPSSLSPSCVASSSSSQVMKEAEKTTRRKSSPSKKSLATKSTSSSISRDDCSSQTGSSSTDQTTSSTLASQSSVKPVAEVKPKKRNASSPPQVNNANSSSCSQERKEEVSKTSHSTAEETVVSSEETPLPSVPTTFRSTLVVVGTTKHRSSHPQPFVPTQNSEEEKEKTTCRQVSVTSDAGSEEGYLSEETPSSSSHSKSVEVQRRSSSGNRRTVGRLSIPSFMEIQDKSPTLKKPVPSYGSIQEAKKKLLERKDSLQSDSSEKERVFPTIPVQEAKIDVERRASIPDPLPLTKGPYAVRLESNSEEGNGMIRGTARKMQIRRQTEPLLPYRETSIWDQHQGNLRDNESSSSLKEEEDHMTITSSTGKTKVIRGSCSLDSTNSSSPFSSSQKSLAKEVLKQQLAKAKLAEEKKRLSESNVEMKSSHGQSSSTGEEVTGNTRVQHNHEEVSRKTRISLHLNLTPASSSSKTNTSSQETASSASDEDDNLSSKGGVSEEGIIEEAPGTPCSESSSLGSIPAPKPAPITRSYKKITFTRDGATISETGKVIFQTGPKGEVIKIEKRSKVTHYNSAGGDAPNNTSNTTCRSDSSSTTPTSSETVTDGVDRDTLDGSASEQYSQPTSPVIQASESVSSSSTGGLRQSDSTSSSGSTDIFDEFFDSWSGDTLFSDMPIMMPRIKPLFPPNLFMRRVTSRSPSATEETVRERIHRKSFYQRFNEDFMNQGQTPHLRFKSPSPARKSSFGDPFLDSPHGLSLGNGSRHSWFRNGLDLPGLPSLLTREESEEGSRPSLSRECSEETRDWNCNIQIVRDKTLPDQE